MKIRIGDEEQCVVDDPTLMTVELLEHIKVKTTDGKLKIIPMNTKLYTREENLI